VATLFAGGMNTLAHAGHDDEYYWANSSNAKWKAECSTCHVAYPPRLLPVESWRVLMGGLDRHFGSDASLDAATAREIAAFLERSAGSRKAGSTDKPILRISETRWFKREHDEVPERVWKNPKVKSPANCGACHIRADSGNFSEHDIRMPR